MNTTLCDSLEQMGYIGLREIEGKLCGLAPFLYTWGVCIGLDADGVEGRFCFDNLGDALAFLNEWDGVTPPIVGEDGCTAIKHPDFAPHDTGG